MSSIDLSNAYNGISGYNVVAVGILVFVNNWAGPIWWAVSALVLMAKSQSKSPEATSKPRGSASKPRREWVEAEHRHLSVASDSSVDYSQDPDLQSRAKPFNEYFSLSTLYISTSLLAVMIACLVLRTHLFIWTVFSPKYLYSMAWSLGYHVFTSLILCGGLWTVAG
jgi:ethanolamine phosphate transferase 2 subunit G